MNLQTHPAQCQATPRLTQCTSRQLWSALRRPKQTGYPNGIVASTDGREVMVAPDVKDPAHMQGRAATVKNGIGLLRMSAIFRKAGYKEDQLIAIFRACFADVQDGSITVQALVPPANQNSDFNAMEGGSAVAGCSPMLGSLGVRNQLDGQGRIHFKTLVKAALIAGEGKALRILLPMVTNVQEVDAAQAVINGILTKLEAQGVPHNKNPKIGVVLEVPAAALIADRIVKKVDFLTINLPFLTQHVLAADRRNNRTVHLYDTFSPAVVSLVRNIVAQGRKEGKLVGVCGAWSDADLALVPFLLGVGVDEIVPPSKYLHATRQLLSKLSFADVCALQEMLDNETSPKTRRMIFVSYLSSKL